MKFITVMISALAAVTLLPGAAATASLRNDRARVESVEERALGVDLNLMTASLEP